MKGRDAVLVSPDEAKRDKIEEHGEDAHIEGPAVQRRREEHIPLLGREHHLAVAGGALRLLEALLAHLAAAAARTLLAVAVVAARSGGGGGGRGGGTAPAYRWPPIAFTSWMFLM